MPDKKPINGCPPSAGTIEPEHGGRIGNPPFDPEPHRQDVRTWAKVASQETIAAKLGITPKTLRKYFHDELADGTFESVAAVGAKLLSKALAGNVGCMIFYLRTRGKWNTRIEHTGPDGGPIETRSLDLTEFLAGKTEAELAALEPLIDALIEAGGGSFDFRSLIGEGTDQGEAGGVDP